MVHTALLCIRFPWAPPTLNLNLFKRRRAFSRYALTYISSGQSTRPLPLEHLDEGDPEAFGETAVDQEVDGRVHDEEEVVHITCGVS